MRWDLRNKIVAIAALQLVLVDELAMVIGGNGTRSHDPYLEA